jgi:hypothetical protein
MFMRILVASATIVALASPAAQAAPLFKLFHGCHFAFQTQCAKNVTKGNHNKARIDQDQWGFGFQFAAQFQHGDGNNAYTGQKGTNDFALTVQDGNNNTAFTSQDGTNQASVTVQSGNGLWGATSTGGSGNLTAVVQAN